MSIIHLNWPLPRQNSEYFLAATGRRIRLMIRNMQAILPTVVDQDLKIIDAHG